MVFIPKEHYLWDFWLVSPDEWRDARALYHLYYLQAPRSLHDPDLRHRVATVGHAVSPDLRRWMHRGTVLEAGLPGSWDDRAIWTGSVTIRDGLAYMFYTGLSQADRAPVQKGTPTIHCSRSIPAGTSRRVLSKGEYRRGATRLSCTLQMSRHTICSCLHASMKVHTMGAL